MNDTTYWWPTNPDIHTFSVFYGSSFAHATWADNPAGAVWVNKHRMPYLYENSHRQVPDLFAILHGIGLYNGT